MSLLLNGRSYTTIHFIGILGSGMSALAQYLQWSGVTVTGSDRLYNDTSTKRMQNALHAIGCHVFCQDGSGVTEQTGAVVISTAIEDTNPDLARAHAMHLPVFHRSDILAACVTAKRTIAVAGTSGKSTVSALIFHLLTACGEKASLIAGANLHELVDRGYIGNACYGSGDLLVIEADESDGSLIKYTPYGSVFLNCSKDHKPVEETKKLFTTLAAQSDHVFYNADDTTLPAFASSHTFGLTPSAEFFPDTTQIDQKTATLKKDNCIFSVPFPGTHMLYNLCASLQVCTFLGCKPQTLTRAASSYKGIQRRFDKIETPRGVTVIDDYAHNPEKISAVLATVQHLAARVFALFQPHGFGPTKFLLQELIQVFNELLRSTDNLYLLPIYYAGGTAAQDISSQDIARGLTASKATIMTPANRDDAIPHIASRAKPGTIVLSMGARDPSLPQFAQQIARALD